MPAAVLKLHRVIADAWSDGLRSWCGAAARAALDGGAESWLVSAHRAQAAWLRRQAMRDGVLLFGIRFLDPEMLRDALCARLRVERATHGDAAAELLLKITAARREDADSAAVAREPGSCLAAMSDLRAAGWTGAELDLPPAAARDFASALARSRMRAPEIDRILRNRAASVKSPPLRTCIVGWDAERWPDLALLEAAATASAECIAFLPLPRVAAEHVQQLWIESVEARLRATREVCKADEHFHSANEALVSRMEKNALAADGTPPHLLVGRDWDDEIALVRDDVIEWLAREPADEPPRRVAIIAPERSASSAAIVRALAAAGIEARDEIGETLEPSAAERIATEAVRYHLQAHDAGALIELCKSLRELLPEKWRYLDPAKVHGALTEAFCTVQSRNARLLVGGEGAPRRQIGQLVEILGKWEGALTWLEAREKWAHTLAQLGVGIACLEPLWSRTRALFRRGRFPARFYLEYLASVLAARAVRRAPEAAAPHARVVVTTLAGAASQTWERVIFLDANEGVWPRMPEENPLLDDAARAVLNARRGRRGWLLTTGDRRALEQARFVDVLENCTGEVVFAGTARDPEAPAREAQPNEWAVRCIAADAAGEKNALERWRDAAQVCAPTRAELPEAEFAHLKNVHASRGDPATPFDRYLFAFHESQYTPGPWPATRLDLALTCPATFALREIFHAEPVQNSGFRRSEGGAIGAHVHAWLAAAFGGGEELQPFFPEAARANLEREITATLRGMTARFSREGLALPLWWETCLQKAAWAARRCFAPLLGFRDGWFFAVENEMRETVATPAGPLHLKGRVDLLLADDTALERARMTILDFKTGRTGTPTLASLRRGDGFQFAAYFLMGKNARPAAMSVAIIRPDGAKLDAFTDADEAALREAAAPLARMQRGRVFGMSGRLAAEWGARERLPMATTPIAPAVLEQKAALTFSAS